MWERGLEIAHTAHFTHEVHKHGVFGWLPIAVVAFLGVLLVGVVVLVFVSTADFGDDPTRTPQISHGPCAPFCTATVNPPPP
ncbi:hypothetical protein [Nocardia sp. NPDC052566]|uniref:hypothetical protein n=1 Tax=Nocardia sp. NPDC052566 TaxID=3364330 RepID=UPI0037C6261C